MITMKETPGSPTSPGETYRLSPETAADIMIDGEGSKAHVLLVEDNLSDAILIRTILEEDESIRVTLAQDGIRGCQLVESQRWDLVVTDVNLPGRDGIEIIQECKRHQPETPILATSAYAAPSYLEGAFRAGANEILAKPVDRTELLGTVRELLDLKARADARPKNILAVGALPGDVEAGCGGIILKHVISGDPVRILVLAAGAKGAEAEDRRAAARRAAQLLGAELIFPRADAPEIGDLDSMVLRFQEAVHGWNPEIILAPSVRDVRDSRTNAYQAAEISGSRVPGFYCYQSATTTLDFRPTRFEDISDYLDQKMAALSHYEAQFRGRPHLDPELARASARYWGRFLGYGEVEPLEVVRHSI
jgi:CheY-like chemotaxis protein/LmbE family N-acetylglucosaminyl deacetylase